MNKTLIIVLAICLVSVHAMVKRDAPAEKPDDTVAKMQEQLSTFAKQVGETIKGSFDPDTIKKNFNDLVDKVNKGIQDIQSQDKPAA